jgi:hypothetical protein
VLIEILNQVTYWYGDVLERYEYDAYGNCTIWDAGFTTERQTSNYGNPYLFQGKRLDMLDNESLKLMAWPYRNYSTYLGRWTQAEKLGMIPNDNKKINSFDVRKQYKDGLGLYEAFASNPVINLDPFGTACTGTSCSTGSRSCGIREYRQSVMAGGGIPHAGILVGLSTDYDFGPGVHYMPVFVPGVCPWPFGGVEWGRTITWDLEIKKTGRIKYGHPERPLCCCATCGDVQECLRRTCIEWNGTEFVIFIRDCWSFVRAAKSNCCLKRK